MSSRRISLKTASKCVRLPRSRPSPTSMMTRLRFAPANGPSASETTAESASKRGGSPGRRNPSRGGRLFFLCSRALARGLLQLLHVCAQAQRVGHEYDHARGAGVRHEALYVLLCAAVVERKLFGSYALFGAVGAGGARRRGGAA